MSYKSETNQCPWHDSSCSYYQGVVVHTPGSRYEPPDSELVEEYCNYEVGTDQLKRMLKAFNGDLKPNHKDYKSEIHDFCPIDVHDGIYLLASDQVIRMIKCGVEMDCWLEEVDQSLYDEEEWAAINSAYLEIKLSHLI
ncbi:MAG TPA: hypothetical protein P5136_01430 [Methanofastidiosum sp.]|nr:hypothetical protein [Methanofastidiosum sp.]